MTIEGGDFGVADTVRARAHLRQDLRGRDGLDQELEPVGDAVFNHQRHIHLATFRRGLQLEVAAELHRPLR